MVREAVRGASDEFVGVQAKRPSSGRVGVDDLRVPVVGIKNQDRRGNGIKSLAQQMTVQFFQ
jgi:hypothetical protein